MRWSQLLGLAIVIPLAGCASRLEGRQLRFHDRRAVKTPPERQEGGRAVESPARRSSAARPRNLPQGHRPLDVDRMDVEAYRVYVRTAEQERRRRYGSPASRPSRRKKARPPRKVSRPPNP